MFPDNVKNRLLHYINGKFGTAHGSRNPKPMYTYFDTLTELFPNLKEQDIYDYLNENDFTDPEHPDEPFSMNNLNADKFSSWYTDHNIKVMKEAEEKATRESELQTAKYLSAASGIGAFEQAMTELMVRDHGEEFSQIILERADAYIKEKYGDIIRKVKFEIPEVTPEDVEGQTYHEKFETILKFVLADEPVMLVGPAGSGKNVICKQIADVLGLNFYFTGKITQEYQIKGFIDANGTYHETPFYKAFTQGGVFMLDEIDASIPEALVALNAAIANRYYDFPTGQVQAHPKFRVIAAGNTFGTGASYTYSGRAQLDGASLDRFAVIYVDYDEEIEKSLTQDTELITFIDKFRKACIEDGIQHITSYRAVSRLSKLDNNGIPKDELLNICLTKNLESDDLNMLKNHFKNDDNPWAQAFCTLVDHHDDPSFA